MKKSFATFSFGCRVNQAEVEEMNRLLVNRGFCPDEANPYLYIINICAVTAKAEREARQFINQIRSRLPLTKIVVTGCAATNWKKVSKMPKNIDILIDNTNKEYLVEIISRKLHFVSSDKLNDNNILHRPDKYESSGRAIVKIQDGCHRFCTFCIVPYLRGTPKSYPISTIVKTIIDLPKPIKEVVLTAVNTEAYGKDTQESFIKLIDTILHSTNIQRISFGSVHPWSIDDKFIEFYKNTLFQERLVNYFHIPLQSGSNKILSLMKRGYTKEKFIERLKAISDVRPLTNIGTDIIVGFLDETDKDFEETYEFLKQTPISRFHVFKFSRRVHTAAYYMAKRLKEPSVEVKIKRSNALSQLSKIKYELFLKKHVDREMKGLVLASKKQNFYQVLLNNQTPVLVKQSEMKPGELYKVRVEKYKTGALFGTIIR